MITLPNECLFEIFNNLQTCNGNLLYRSLFSSLLVNRQWCRVIVSILWSKPALRDKRVIRICLLSLNDKEKALLIPFNIKLPNNPTPLFEYTSYINYLTFFSDNPFISFFSDNLELGIKCWLEKKSPISRSFTLISAIKCSLITMFLRTSGICGRLKHLSFFGIINNKTMVIEHICNTTLTSLKLQYNCLSSEDGKAIAKVLYSNSLTSLDLKYNQIGSDGGKAIAEALYKNTTLTSLDLSYNQLCFEGGKAIAEVLRVNSSLTYLDLAGNYIGSEGAKAIAESLYINSTLTYLDISSNDLCFEGGKAIAEALCKNTTLTYL